LQGFLSYQRFFTFIFI